MENFKEYQNSFSSVRLYVYFPKEKELRSYESLFIWSYFLFLQKGSPHFMSGLCIVHGRGALAEDVLL